MAKVYTRRITAQTKSKSKPKPQPTRRRNAAATRAAILASARAAFASAGYDGAGVREIAKGAGVTAMLVNRYFGSKEQLFAEVMVDVMAHPIVLTPQNLASPKRADAIAAALIDLTTAGQTPVEGFRIMLSSAASPRAAEIARDQIAAHHHKQLTAVLKGPHAAQRAALVLAFAAGIQAMRQMIQLPALATCPPGVLVKLLEPVFRQLLD